MSTQSTSHRFQFFPGQRNLMQNAAPVFQQHHTRLGQTDATAIAQQKGLTQFNFELAHMAAQKRLRQAKRQCRAREAAHFCHPDKGFDLLEVHGFGSYNNRQAMPIFDIS